MGREGETMSCYRHWTCVACGRLGFRCPGPGAQAGVATRGWFVGFESGLLLLILAVIYGSSCGEGGRTVKYGASVGRGPEGPRLSRQHWRNLARKGSAGVTGRPMLLWLVRTPWTLGGIQRATGASWDWIEGQAASGFPVGQGLALLKEKGDACRVELAWPRSVQARTSGHGRFLGVILRKPTSWRCGDYGLGVKCVTAARRLARRHGSRRVVLVIRGALGSWDGIQPWEDVREVWAASGGHLTCPPPIAPLTSEKVGELLAVVPRVEVATLSVERLDAALVRALRGISGLRRLVLRVHHPPRRRVLDAILPLGHRLDVLAVDFGLADEMPRRLLGTLIRVFEPRALWLTGNLKMKTEDFYRLIRHQGLEELVLRGDVRMEGRVQQRGIPHRLRVIGFLQSWHVRPGRGTTLAAEVLGSVLGGGGSLDAVLFAGGELGPFLRGLGSRPARATLLAVRFRARTAGAMCAAVRALRPSLLALYGPWNERACSCLKSATWLHGLSWVVRRLAKTGGTQSTAIRVIGDVAGLLDRDERDLWQCVKPWKLQVCRIRGKRCMCRDAPTRLDTLTQMLQVATGKGASKVH